jgi:hypothetical protein
MAFPDIIETINSDQTIVTAGDPTRFYSRWVRGVVDPRLNGYMHVVYELIGQSASDDMGFSYILWDMVTQTVVRRVDVEPPRVTGTVDFRYPDIAVNPVDGRIWIVYVEGGNEANPFTNIIGQSLYATYSQDMGATWLHRRQIVEVGNSASGAPQHVLPRVAFGLDGTGYLSAYRSRTAAPDESEHRIYRHDNGSWILDHTQSHTTTVKYPAPAPLAVNASGHALCLVPDRINTTQVRMQKLVNTGSGWTAQGSVSTYTGSAAVPEVYWGELKYDLRNDVFQFLTYPVEASAGNEVQHIEFNKNFQVNYVQTTGWSPFAAPVSGKWMSVAVTTLGNIYVFASVSTSSIAQYRRWDRATNTWDSTSTNPAWEDQIGDHGAAVEPGGTGGGCVGEYLGRLQVFVTGDEVPTAGTQEYLWAAQDSTVEDVDRDDLFLRAGNITAIGNYEAYDDDLTTTLRRVIVWAGGNCYHDGGVEEFVGNAIEDGAFEAPADFAVFENYLYIADGENTLSRWHVDDEQASTVVNTWDGNDLVPPGPVPVPIALEVGRNRLWAVTRAGQVVFSGLRVATEWNLEGPTLDDADPGFFYINDFPDGELPIAIKEFYGSRYVFSQNGCVRIKGDRPGILMADVADVESMLAQTQGIPYTVEQISNTIGCVSNRTVVDIGSDLLFLSRKGVHSLMRTEKHGDVEQSYVSAPIQTLFRSLNKGALARASATNYKRKNWYVINVSRDVDSGALKTLLIFDYAQNKWFTWSFDFEITCLGTRINAESNEEELLAGTSQGHVIVLDQDSRLNAMGALNTTATLQSQWLHDGEAGTYDKFTRLIVHHGRPSAGLLTGRMWVDGSLATTFTLDQNPFGVAMIGNFLIGDGGGSPILGDAIGIGGSFVPVKSSAIINKRGRALKVELESTEGNMSVSGLQVQIVPGKFRDTI